MNVNSDRRVSCTRPSFRGLHLAVLFTQQYNSNCLRSRHSELHRNLLPAPIDILALQEANVLPFEGRSHNYTAHHNRPGPPNGMPKDLLYVHIDVNGAEVDLSSLRSLAAAYVGVPVAASGSCVSIISAYVWQNCAWDATDIT